jgi:hypothetical protein
MVRTYKAFSNEKKEEKESKGFISFLGKEDWFFY